MLIATQERHRTKARPLPQQLLASLLSQRSSLILQGEYSASVARMSDANPRAGARRISLAPSKRSSDGRSDIRDQARAAPLDDAVASCGYSAPGITGRLVRWSA